MPQSPQIIDDKSPHCIPFLLSLLETHQSKHPDSTRPFFLGLNGVQGAGKTVLVSTLHSTLTNPPYSLNLVTLSLDDIYLTHDDQVTLAKSNPTNPLLQHRGQPSTHDLRLGEQVFASLREGKETAIPRYDKAKFGGEGDRVDSREWEVVNRSTEGKVKVVVFEGWCVGFRAWDEQTLYAKWESAVRTAKQQGDGYRGRLGRVRFEDVKAVNDALWMYDGLTE